MQSIENTGSSPKNSSDQKFIRKLLSKDKLKNQQNLLHFFGMIGQDPDKEEQSLKLLDFYPDIYDKDKTDKIKEEFLYTQSLGSICFQP